MLILNGYKFLYVYICYRFNAYLEWLQIFICIYAIDLMLILNGYKFLYVYMLFIFIFGRGPCHIVVLGGPGSQKGA